MKQYPLNPTFYYANFRDYLDGIRAYGNSPAICWFDREANQNIKTYDDLHRDVSALRRTMFKKGLCGKRVAIAGENSYEWLAVFLAVVSGGGVAICLDTDQDDSTLANLLSMTDSEIVFTNDCLKDLFSNFDSSENGEGVYIMGSECEDGNISVSSMINEGLKLPNEPALYLNPDDTAAIMFTSGTTAMPKAVELTHRNILTNIGDAFAVIDLRDSVFTCLPFYHAYGLCNSVLYSLLMGAKVNINSSLRFAMRDLYLSKAVTFIAVPLMLDIYYKEAMRKAEELGKTEKVKQIIKKFTKFEPIITKFGRSGKRDLTRSIFGETKIIICGGAHADPEISRNIEAFGIDVIQGYGITECSPLVAVGRKKTHRRDNVGVLLPSYQIKFDEGEILLKGPAVMKGYYKNPEETAAILNDGWLRTGDIGEMTSDGYLSITGRIKNLIVLKNGKKISPEKIELALLDIPMVKEVRVFGAPSGETEDDVCPAATVYPDPALSSQYADFEILGMLQDSIKKINDSLPAFQQIQIVTLRDTPFERTATNKIKR